MRPDVVVVPELTVRYADLALRLKTEDSQTRFSIGTPHTAFRIPDSSPADLEITCREGMVAELDPPYHPDGETAWVARTRPSGELELFFYGRRYSPVVEAYIGIVIDRDFRTGRAIYKPSPDNQRVIPYGFPVDEHLIARLLMRRGGCVLHACALEKNGVARVFVGHTGAGKSTIAEIGEGTGASVMSDDRTIIRIRDGIPYAYGTPWHGSYKRGLPGGAPVEGVFLLVQDSEDRVERLEPVAAFGELFVRVVLPSVDGNDSIAAVDTLGELVRACPVGALHFLPTPNAMRLAEAFSAERVTGAAPK
jgi:hypothetical protein